MPDPHSEFSELDRRKPNAQGRWVRFGDGVDWLLPSIRYCPGAVNLTVPKLDDWVNQFHELVVLSEEVELVDLMSVARLLLLENYTLTDSEVGELLCVSVGAELTALGHAVFLALFGDLREPRSYLRWVRASLAAGGVSELSLTADNLADVLAILVATGRTVPAASFIDACREVDLRESLEQLV